MIKSEKQVSRKMVNEDRIAVCSHFGCLHLEKVKPLKFRFLGFRKYPKCSKHKIPLVFVDEFIGSFIDAVNVCLFDKSSLPSKSLINLIKNTNSDELMTFLNDWAYCIPIGRGAQNVSQYMDGLSRGYIKILSRRQRNVLTNEKNSRNRYKMLRLGLKKIADEYATFLKELREKSEELYDPKNLGPLSDNIQKVLKKWLYDHLKTINGIRKSASPKQEESLSMLKEEFDKILHAGTCALLLGKSPSIVTKTISAFELFSAYYEFLKAGLCDIIKTDDIELIMEEFQEFLNSNGKNILYPQGYLPSESGNLRDENNEFEKDEKEMVKLSNINVANFRQKIRNHIENLHKSINGMQKQKRIICSKSFEVLDEFISRAINNEFTVPENSNLKLIASTIIYTVLISNKNMPKINITQLSNIQHDRITKYYVRYFRDLYPRIKFHFASYKGFNNIRNIISLYFFRLIKDSKVKKSKLVIYLRNNILEKTNLPKKLTKENNDVLFEMATRYKDTFIKYFSDLVEVVDQLIISSNVHRKIGANLIIRYLADFLEENNTNLLQKSDVFYHSLIEIFDYLKEYDVNFFPTRSHTQTKLPNKQRYKRDAIYRKIVGYKLKLFVIKTIYNGRYYKNGKCKCPRCLKEGLNINTDEKRLTALEFHHSTDEKENLFSSDNLYNIFAENRSNPNFLRDLIELMESEKVILVCRNHHRSLFHSEYYNYFKYIINKEELFSFSAELIHIIIRTCIENFYLTKNLSTKTKRAIRRSIKRYIKKRYILETFYGKFCPTCEEFNIKENHSIFSFHHNDDNSKTIEAIDLYDLPCSEIIRILEQEKGGYLCANCHTIIHYKHIHILDKIYDNDEIVKSVFNDYKNVCNKYTLIHRKRTIRDPLKKDIIIDESIERYLTAIYEISKSEHDVTSTALMNYMGLTRTRPILIFFRRKNSFIKNYVKVVVGRGRHPTKFVLTEEGKDAIKIIQHFKNYYSSLHKEI